MSIFVMPSLGADMEDATLVEWLASTGDTVARGDVIAVVETQKGAIEIEVFETGEVRELYAKVGETLPVGAPLARIGDDVSEPPPTPARPPTSPTLEAPVAIAVEAAIENDQAARPPAPAGVRASPAARALAAEHGLALTDIAGSWPDGAIVLADIEKAIQTSVSSALKAPPTRKHGLNLDEMRKAISAAMARSKQTIPHYYVSQTVDLQRTSDWLTAWNAERPPDERLLLTAVFVKATAQAVHQAPALNGRYESEPFQPSSAVHVGVAVALRGGGLVAPAIHDVDRMSLDDLMASMRDLVTRARAGRLRGSEMTDGTITVSAIGDRGVDAMAGVIYPPQTALIGFGAPVLRPWAVDGEILARQVVTVTVAADHRVSDGRAGARFLFELDTLLQTPEAL